MGCVYLATNTINGKMYVGKTKWSISHRKYEHEHCTKRGSTLLFHRALRKYGFDVFTWSCLFRSNDDIKLFDREVFYIKLLNTKGCCGYNLTDGGVAGWHHCESTKEKCYKTFSGCKHSLESRLKISMACKGRKCSAETRAKMSKVNTGKVLSAQHRAKISASVSKSLTGKKASLQTKAKMSASHRRLAGWPGY